MRMEQSFEVQAPLEQVWSALIDLERVAPCLPGAAITGRDEDGTYRGSFSVKLGPMTASYNGTIKVEAVDEAAHTATLKAKGTDKRGQGGANATIVNTLTERDGVTHVDAVTDFTITGRLAQFGRGGIMEDVSNRLMRDFATCLSTRLGEGPPAETEVPSGAEVTAGDAAPEEVAAAPATPESAGSAAATGTASPGASGAAAPSTPPPAATPPAAVPVKGFSLVVSVLWERIKRIFSRKT